jgi:hypothetical protein
MICSLNDAASDHSRFVVPVEEKLARLVVWLRAQYVPAGGRDELELGISDCQRAAIAQLAFKLCTD